jgi:hypothetical protein
MPINALLIRGLLISYAFYGDDFKVECPTGSGTYMTLFEVARELGHRLASISSGMSTERGPSTGEHASSRKTRTGEIISCSTSTSMGTTVPVWERAIKQAGRL